MHHAKPAFPAALNSRRFLCLVAMLIALSAISVRAFFLSGFPVTRVLIVDGFSNHDWRQTTALIRGILLESKGQFMVDVSTAPQTTNATDWAAWRPKFSNYDVVIQNCNNYGQQISWPEPVKKDFVDFVRKGGGVYIFHSAENAFVGWKEYEQMIGLCWRHADYGTAIRVSEDGSLVRIPPGTGSDTGHGSRGNSLVTRLGDDLIHAGMPRQWLSPDMEVYYYARGPAENVTVLAYARDSKPGQGFLWPVEWTTTYGKGRVYVSTYGHVWRGDVQPASMRCAAVQTIIPRAVQWLAKSRLFIPIPPDFPGTNTVSLRGDVPLSQ